MTDEIKYPEVEVQLTDEDGNAFAIIGKVMKAMRRAKIREGEIVKYRDQATSGDYDHLLKTTTEWVTVL